MQSYAIPSKLVMNLSFILNILLILANNAATVQTLSCLVYRLDKEPNLLYLVEKGKGVFLSLKHICRSYTTPPAPPHPASYAMNTNVTFSEIKFAWALRIPNTYNTYRF
jgi:hypothetical protein